MKTRDSTEGEQSFSSSNVMGTLRFPQDWRELGEQKCTVVDKTNPFFEPHKDPVSLIDQELIKIRVFFNKQMIYDV